MPRYYFDLHNDMEARDEEGRVLPDLAAAKADLLLEAREMIQASIGDQGRIDLRHYINLRDESGAIVHTMHFDDAVIVERGGHAV